MPAHRAGMPSVHFEFDEAVAIIKLDDGKANALSYGLMDELDAALERAKKEASAVVLTGRAGRFSGGFDLQEMMAGPDRARELVSRGAKLLLDLYTLPVPLVTACTGHALAGGALMLVTGDVRLATRGNFRIGLNEIAIGLPVPVLAMELARDRLASKHFVAATLFATIYDPEQALVAGWVDEVADAENLVAAALVHAKKLGQLSKDAYAKTKMTMRERTVEYIRSTLARDLERLVPSMP